MAFDLDEYELKATRELNGVGSMSEEEIIEFIDQENGIQREYKHKPILEKNIVNVGIAIQSALNLYQQEKEKNKKLQEEKEAFANVVMNAHKVINNLARAVKFMGTNGELTTEDIIKMFSPEEIKMNFDDFMKLWENEQRKKGETKDKVIDLMAEELLQDGIFVNSTVKDVEEYYFKKARGEDK